MFREYNKLKTAEQHLTALIYEGERQLEYLNSVLDETERAETEDDLAEIKAELEKSRSLVIQSKKAYLKAANRLRHIF